MYFRFRDFWSITYKRNCHNCRTSDDIDMKLGPLFLTRKTKKSVKNFDNDVILTNCDVTVIFPIYGQFGAIPAFYLTKTENTTKQSLTQLSHYWFEQRYSFCQKMLKKILHKIYFYSMPMM